MFLFGLFLAHLQRPCVFLFGSLCGQTELIRDFSLVYRLLLYATGRVPSMRSGTHVTGSPMWPYDPGQYLQLCPVSSRIFCYGSCFPFSFASTLPCSMHYLSHSSSCVTLRSLAKQNSDFGSTCCLAMTLPTQDGPIGQGTSLDLGLWRRVHYRD